MRGAVLWPRGKSLSSIAPLARDWDDAASEAMYWSIVGEEVVTAEQFDAFFASGRTEIAAALRRGDDLSPAQRRDRALDFGCGVGRLTRALAEHFSEVVGVDVAWRMIEQARRLNTSYTNCRFSVLSTPDLRSYDDASFDLVFSHLVLQHLGNEGSVTRYVGDFVRLVREGGLVIFQIPSYMPIRRRLQPRRRVYGVLRRAGIPRSALFRLGFQPIRMTAVRRETVERVLRECGATLLAVDSADWPTGIRSSTYYAKR